MNMKAVAKLKIRLNTIFLCISIFSGLLYSCIGTSPSSSTYANDPLNQENPADTVEVAYFHRNYRCEACIYAEERIIYIINTFFHEELTSGKLVFEIYNISDKKNDAAIRKYGAIGSQLFVNCIQNGANNIRYIEEIWYWGVIDNEEVFDKTIKDIINRSLYGG